jgi:hypothetical protein
MSMGGLRTQLSPSGHFEYIVRKLLSIINIKYMKVTPEYQEKVFQKHLVTSGSGLLTFHKSLPG